MQVSLETSNSRQLQRKREVDAIKPRQKEFDEKEAKVIEYYRGKGLVGTIDTNPNRNVQFARGELALQNRAFLQHVSARIKRVVKGKIPNPKRRQPK